MNATYLRHMGTDLDVVNNAKVSFFKSSRWDEITNELTERDKGLIRFLADGMSIDDANKLMEQIDNAVISTCGEPFALRGQLWALIKKIKRTPTHWAPFANGTTITFHVKAPIPIMRQLFKSKVGAVESEVSRRYVDDEPEFFEPVWREKAGNVKQGSGGEIEDNVWFNELYGHYMAQTKDAYTTMICNGVCAEQARFILPQSMYTEAIISHSLYGWANVYNQRADATHAQKEVSDLAVEIGLQIQGLFPVSWPALTA